MKRYLKQSKFLLFLATLFTAISSLSYVFIAILLQKVMDIVDTGNMNSFIRILIFSLNYFALMGVFMYLQETVKNLVSMSKKIFLIGIRYVEKCCRIGMFLCCRISFLIIVLPVSVLLYIFFDFFAH